jgi:hypothetical protein
LKQSLLLPLSLLSLAFCLLAPRAEAAVHRFAIVIGNNVGDTTDAPLRYAESDANRIYEVLRDLGGFTPVNSVLLKGESARTVEDTLIAVNERVRMALAQPDAQAVLFVYYSGHADAEALHLGQTRLSTRRLSALIGGSASTFRLLVLDACRSGSVTRRKGGRIVKASSLFTEQTLPETGAAFLTASAAHEDAQESDEIRGSFFTHALVSGLLGAADQNDDGAISLHEVYQYAYSVTLRATSRTSATQHPAFRFDFAGQGALALTRPHVFAKSRAELRFVPNVGFLVLRDGPDGPVVGEIGARDRHRTLSVKPGRYFIRGRGSDVLFEGRFEAAPGKTTLIDTRSMARTDYARLVRKGGRDSGNSHGPELGPWMRTRLSNADSVCKGGFLGYAVQLEHFSVRSRLGMCTSTFSNERIEARVNEYDLELRVARGLDVSIFSFDVGLGAGAALFMQRFETRGLAPGRDSVSPYLLLDAGAGVELGEGYVAGVGAAGETHFLRFESESEAARPMGEFAARVNGFVRKWF